MITYNLMPLYLTPPTYTLETIKQAKGKRTIAQQTTKLTIAQLNLNYDNPNIKQLLPILGNKNYDLLVLQEASDTEYENIKKLEKYYPYSFGIGEAEGTPSGMAVFSRWPIIEKHLHRLGYKSGEIIEVIIQVTGTAAPIQIYAIHPGSPRTKKLWLLRNQTLAATGERVANSPFANKMVIGDFNSSPWTGSFKDFQKSSQLKNSAEGFGYIPSWSYSVRPTLSLFSSVYVDHHLVSEPFKVLKKHHLLIQGSDHLLLLTKLAI